MPTSLQPVGSGESSTRELRPNIPVAELAANALRAALLDGELRPGDPVNQYAWADRLGISRSALREGLKVLTSSKVLEHDQNRGYRVASLSVPEMADLYWLRIVVEREVALATRHPTESEARRLIAVRAALASSLLVRSSRAVMDAEREFSFAIYDLSERTLLAREAKRLWELAAVYRSAVLEVALTQTEEVERLRERRDRQLKAALDGDRYSLAEIIVNERRIMIQRFQAERFLPGP